MTTSDRDRRDGRPVVRVCSRYHEAALLPLAFTYPPVGSMRASEPSLAFEPHPS